MPCDVPREDLSAYIDDELTAERKAEIETHLLECDECSAELAFLLSGNRSVESLVEYGTPRSFETELRDRVLTYRPTRLRWWSLGGRVEKRHVVAALCAVCGIALLVVALWLRLLVVQPPLEPVPPHIAEPSGEPSATAPQPAGQVSAQVVEPQPIPVPPGEPEEPTPVAPPSPHEGWWMLNVGSASPFQYPVRIDQQDGELVMYAWGRNEPLGAGIELDDRFAMAGSDGLSLEIEFSRHRPEFTGFIERQGEPARRVSADRIGRRLADTLDSTGSLPLFIDRRLADARKLSAALYTYARANRDRFPSALDDLVPQYLPDDSAFADTADRETVYIRSGMIPTDQVVDWTSYDAELLSVEDRFSLLDQRSVARFHAFFEEMVIEHRHQFPQGRTIVYLDGSVAWDGVINVPALLLPEIHSRIAAEHERICKTRLDNLGDALLRFAADHDGLFPTRIEMLWPTYLTNAENLCCPSRSPREVAFDVICLGERLPTEDEIELEPDLLGTIPLAVEIEDAHRDGFHMVTADGHTVWRPAYER